MKSVILFVSCIVCFSTASFHDVLDQDLGDLVAEFWEGMEQAPHLSDMTSDFAEEAKLIEEEVKSHLAWALREELAKSLKNVRDAFDRAQEGTDRLMDKAAELVEKLKTLPGAGNELKDRMVEQWIQVFVQRVSEVDKSSGLIRVPLELDSKTLMENVKQNIMDRLDVKTIVEFVKTKLAHLGEIGRALLEALQRPDALQKLQELVEVLLPGLRMDYGIADIWEKVRDFFKDLGIKIADKFSAFSKWVTDVAGRGWANIKEKAGKLKELAKTVASKAGTMSKQVAQQALEFFQEHKSEIGQAAWAAVQMALKMAIAHYG